MPSFPVVIEDTSPMLNFSPTDWRAGVSGDSQLDQYSQSSYLLTQTDGATISLDFYGSSVQIFGSKRSYHGMYKVQLDKNPYQSFSGLSYTELFQQSLFSANMTLGAHEIRITNENITFTDVDYITFQSYLGKDNESLIVNTFQDGHPSFKYAPPSSWKTPDKAGTFIGSTGHATTDPMASANFTFHLLGDAVALYGPVGPDSCTAYSIKVNNGSPSLFSSNRQFYKPQQILFYAGNLGAGEHTLQIQLPGSSSSGEFAVDFATVYTAPSLGGSEVESGDGTASPSSSTVPASISPDSTKHNRDLIVGIAVSAGIAIVAILACVYLFWRRSKVRPHTHKDEVPQMYSRTVSPFTSLPSAQPINTDTAEFQIVSQPLIMPPGLTKQRSKYDLNGQIATTNHRRAETSTSASESMIQSIQQAEATEPRMAVDTSILPPQYTLSPDNPRNSSQARTI